jgi:signal transduction histidine kinase
MFERLHTRTQFQGSGMGLAICRKIVERHGGSIAVTSIVGQGTTFTVSLPVNQAAVESTT